MPITKAYSDYIKSDAWAKKRQACFAYHGKRCKACRTAYGPIHVHHLDYTRLFRENPATDLWPLCAPCHRSVTKIYRSNRRRGLRRVTIEYVTTKRNLAKRQRQG